MKLRALIDNDVAVADKSLLDRDVAGITADSRRVRPGFVFAALPGAKADGLDFARDAIAAGAVAVLASRAPQADVPHLIDANPRRRLALMAAKLAGRQPATIAAVTGTNGKTSTAHFLQQIWQALGHKSASLGTLGIRGPGVDREGGLTTADPVTLHADLAALAEAGITHAAMEASSHGLDQYRLDGVAISAAAFLNLTHEHLDYHKTMTAYRAAKFRLFGELLPRGAPAVLNADSPDYAALRALSAARGHVVIPFGRNAGEHGLAILQAAPEPDRIRLALRWRGREYAAALPVVGAFQAGNAAAALAIALGLGADPAAAVATLEKLTGAPGRLELAARHPEGAPIYVDYAHKPEALEFVLQALRPITKGKLAVVFGCGGDRDRAKRPMMGAIAQRLADRVIVTDDNPRSEVPAAIRAEILAAAPGAIEIGDRREAIAAAIAELGAGDVLVIAGKGHERGQIVAGTVHPFDDAAVAREIAAAPPPRRAPAAVATPAEPPALWTSQAAEAAIGAVSSAPWRATGISIDSRTVKPGDLFVAIKGEKFDGHDFAAAALKNGAAAALVTRGRIAGAPGPLLEVEGDPLDALVRLARAARDRAGARVIGVTGSVGKTGTKEALRTVLSAQGATHASAASHNNLWGVPLSVAALPAAARFGVFEMGMNHAGEIAPLTRLVRPHVCLITWVAAVHIEFFASVADIARAKAEIFQGAAGGTAVLPRDNEHYALLREAAFAAGMGAVLSFGEHPEADIRLLHAEYRGDSSEVTIDLAGRRLHYVLGSPGRHAAANSLGVLGAAMAAGADPERAALSLIEVTPPAGRGRRHVVAVAGGSATLLDESYNASPESMRAAFATLALTPVGAGGRRIAVLGDMRELGAEAEALHVGLALPLVACGIDRVLCCGPHMAALHRALPERLRGAHAPDSAALLPIVLDDIRAGDAVMVKGSLGSRMAPIVKALLARGTGAGGS